MKTRTAVLKPNCCVNGKIHADFYFLSVEREKEREREREREIERERVYIGPLTMNLLDPFFICNFFWVGRFNVK